jgi:hypothetical protein
MKWQSGRRLRLPGSKFPIIPGTGLNGDALVLDGVLGLFRKVRQKPRKSLISQRKQRLS